jgi:hypothetical protein
MRRRDFVAGFGATVQSIVPGALAVASGERGSECRFTCITNVQIIERFGRGIGLL